MLEKADFGNISDLTNVAKRFGTIDEKDSKILLMHNDEMKDTIINGMK